MTLFGFQKEDVEKLQGVRHRLIANAMGTGKTYEAIELDKLTEGQTLVICPLSVIDSWRQHYADLTDKKVRVINPKKRQLLLMEEADVYVVHWDALRLMPELQRIEWGHIIADEVHRAQNRKAQQTRALKKLKAKRKTGLSGTPFTNKPDQFFSILQWLYPREWTSYWKFYDKYVEWELDYTDKGAFRRITGTRNENELQERIAPYYVRRKKEDVLPDLPAKYYTEIWVDLTPAQARAYKQMKEDMLAWLGEQENVPLAAPVVIAQLTRLQQFAVAYAEVSSLDGSVSLAEPSSKLDALMEIVEDNPNEQFVIFSQFSQLVRLVSERLTKARVPHGVLTGSVPEAQRARLIRDFQIGDIRVFVGTIAAGGVGITLTASSTVVFLDRAWSPALNEQAEDRLHRIGQGQAVQVIDIMARGTVDLGRKAQLELKKEWIRRLLDGT